MAVVKDFNSLNSSKRVQFSEPTVSLNQGKDKQLVGEKMGSEGEHPAL